MTVSIRVFDVLLSTAALLISLPVLLLAAIAIRLSDPGPVVFRAQRVGLGGRPFSMFKLRTMRLRPETGPRVSAQNDKRVFWVGGVLRTLKIDELPQFFNILCGDMSIVGPRPEDPAIVRDSYTSEALETLSVRPGLLSPGTIYYYSHLEALLDGDDPMSMYLLRVLPVKIAMDRVYLRQVSLSYNIRLMIRTASVILGKALGRKNFAEPPELLVAVAQGYLPIPIEEIRETMKDPL